MITRFLGSAAAITAGISALIVSSPAPAASAEPCPDVEVVYARGTGEEGLGSTGQAFIDALRPRIGSQSMGIYSVNYPASEEWATGVDGVRDAGAHVNSMAAAC
ncbi:MAG: cutinase family protein, partial [Mycobacteriaceae bacterium]|nr:cutinase family protein [Mycobacteriaceae bacterium]